MPPQSNNMYSSGRNRKTGKATRFCTDELSEYKQAMEMWALAYSREIKSCRAALLDLMGDQVTMIRLDRWFLFDKSRLISKYNLPRPLDATNRIKAFDDALAKALLIDDKFFWRGTEEKIEIDDGKPDQVVAVLTLTKRRCSSDLFAALSGENPLSWLLGS